MVNLYRGEIEAELGGRRFRLCLTLAALAELESELGEGDILSLAERFEKGRLSSLDAICIIGAGLRGAGHEISNAEVGRLPAAAGAVTYVDIVARLLKATFTPEIEKEPPKGNRSPPPVSNPPSPGGA
jgi:hypothetical protein